MLLFHPKLQFMNKEKSVVRSRSFILHAKKKIFLQFAYQMIEFFCFQFLFLVMAAGRCLLVVLFHFIIIEAFDSNSSSVFVSILPSSSFYSYSSHIIIIIFLFIAHVDGVENKSSVTCASNAPKTTFERFFHTFKLFLSANSNTAHGYTV